MYDIMLDNIILGNRFPRWNLCEQWLQVFRRKVFFLVVYDAFLQKHARKRISDFEIFTVSYNIPRAVYISFTRVIYTEKTSEKNGQRDCIRYATHRWIRPTTGSNTWPAGDGKFVRVTVILLYKHLYHIMVSNIYHT